MSAYTRLLLIAVTSLALLAAAPASQAETFGRTTVGATASGGLRAEYKRGSKFTLSQAGSITQICGYVDGNGGVSGTQPIRYALYRDASGSPGAKVVATEEVDIVQGMGPQWLCLETGFMPLVPGSYWLMLHSSGPAGIARYYHDGANNYVGNADSFEDGAADPFGTAAPGNGTVSLYASYTRSTILHTSGRTTTGRNAHSAAHDYQRGSSFVLTEPARINALTAYIGDTGHGFVYNVLAFNLYQDQNGKPTKRLPVSGGPLIEIPIDPHFDSDIYAPRWLNAGTAPFVLQPGRYWFMIHNGVMDDEVPSGGALQYFSDGTGNWYGGPDAVWDGASDPFTSLGGPGNGTISAFVSYEPGPFVTKQWGRRTSSSHVIATLPQYHLYASKFLLPDSRATLAGFHLYLDGLGGGIGSGSPSPPQQWVRIVVFNDSGSKQLVAHSGNYWVTSGDAPKWVDIPMIEPAALPKGAYWVGIQSGEPNANIARIYGDGTGNLLSRPREDITWGVDYLDPPESPAQRGNGTISVYGDYVVPQK